MYKYIFSDIYVAHLKYINIYFQTYAADIFFGQEWKDHRLQIPDNITR